MRYLRLALGAPEVLITPSRCSCSGEDALCIVLRCLASTGVLQVTNTWSYLGACLVFMFRATTLPQDRYFSISAGPGSRKIRYSTTPCFSICVQMCLKRIALRETLSRLSYRFYDILPCLIWVCPLNNVKNSVIVVLLIDNFRGTTLTLFWTVLIPRPYN